MKVDEDPVEEEEGAQSPVADVREDNETRIITSKVRHHEVQVELEAQLR